MSQQEAALAMAAHGWHVFPVDHPELPQCAGVKTKDHNPATCPRDKRGKHPAVKWDTGASTSAQNITYWWSGNPRNVGLHTGKSGLLVIDEDEPGEFARFAADHGVEVPETFTVQTANGKHYYFADTEAGELGNKEGAFGDYHINVRSGRGYVVAHGSKHETGITYLANGTRAVADLPGWVVGAIRGKQPGSSDRFSDPSGSYEGFELPDVITEGHRDEVLYRYACSMRSYDLPFNTALILMKDAWNRCEQPPVTKTRYEWDTAVIKLKTAYGRYDGGRSEEYQKSKEEESAAQTDEDHRRLVLTPASEIKPRRVRWLWDERLALGILALLAGREGLGKSILAYWLAAQITRGTLPGEFFGTPKSVLVAATEDSWSQTIVPRLIAAGADRSRVFRVEIMVDTVHDELVLPKDLQAVKRAARETDAALLILDPLISRLDDRIDSHKDAEVRRALEPTVRMADEINLSVLGLIHHNKSGSTDPLQLVMASKAFPAVARSVHTVVPDPDDDTNARRLFGTPKNNLGRSDLPTLGFTIDSYPIEVEEEPGIAWTGRLIWGDDSSATIHDAMRRAAETPDQKSATAEAAEWLGDHLASKGGTDRSAAIKVAGHKAGHSESALRGARKRLGLTIEPIGFPRETWWSLPGTQPDQKATP